jgi:hypothetical protein
MRYFIATNKIDVFHFGGIVEGGDIATGQPYITFYITEQEMIDALTELTGDPEYYNTHGDDTQTLLAESLPPPEFI